MSFVAESPAKRIVPTFGWIEDALTPFAEPVLRIATGLILMPHGAQKLFGGFGGYGIDGTGQYFATQLHLPASLALLAGLIEFFGGLALAAGFATRVAAALVVGMMSVAIVCVHLPNGFFWTSGGFEYPLLWGIVALYFVVRGGGHSSVDAAIGREI
jgi:putative oxidoreductase